MNPQKLQLSQDHLALKQSELLHELISLSQQRYQHRPTNELTREMMQTIYLQYFHNNDLLKKVKEANDLTASVESLKNSIQVVQEKESNHIHRQNSQARPQ